MAREVRFGIRAGDRYSQYWTVRAAAKGRDVYVSSHRTGRFLHVSVHDPAYGLHVKVDAPDGPQKHHVPLPQPLAPGAVRLVELRVARATATFPAPAGRQVAWVDAPEDPELLVAFEVVAMTPEAFAADDPVWMRGVLPVGVIVRADGSAVGIVAWAMRAEGGSLTISIKPEVRERLKEAFSTGHDIRTLLQGINPDGSLWFQELRSEAAASASDAGGATRTPR